MKFVAARTSLSMYELNECLFCGHVELTFSIPHSPIACKPLLRRHEMRVTTPSLITTEGEANAVSVLSIVYSSISGRVKHPRATCARRSTVVDQANIIGECIAISAERIPINLAGIEIDQAVGVGVLQL